MKTFGSAALVGLAIGLIWGVGCALALLYSIYLAGYRRAVEESQAVTKPKRFLDALEKIRQKTIAKRAT
jgi:hypothetical protein